MSVMAWIKGLGIRKTTSFFIHLPDGPQNTLKNNLSLPNLKIITAKLAKIIAKYHPVWINTHFNHPREITPEATKACDILSSSGIPLGNQTV